MLDDDIKATLQQRIKTLLFDDTIKNYKNHETFTSKSKESYEFLIWKLQPLNWDAFSNEIENLMKQGYDSIPGAWDVSTYNAEDKTGYKVVALYKNNKFRT